MFLIVCSRRRWDVLPFRIRSSILSGSDIVFVFTHEFECRVKSIHKTRGERIIVELTDLTKRKKNGNESLK